MTNPALCHCGCGRAASEVPPLPMTIAETAALHNVSITTVKKWKDMGRIKSERRGGGSVRAHVALIWEHNRPAPAAPGSLSEAQRSAWNKGRKKKAETTST